MRLCSIDGCSKKHRSNGYCQMHSQRVKRHGSPGSPEAIRVRSDGCSFDGCSKKHKAKGYCIMHYARVLKHGSPDVVKQLRRRSDGTKQCADCHEVRPINEIYGFSYCILCYRRRKRHTNAKYLSDPNNRARVSARRKARSYPRSQRSAYDYRRQTDRDTKLQRATAEKAINNRKPWTDEEMYVLFDSKLSRVQKAVILGRSYGSVIAAIRKHKERNPYVN